jgi:hypothetical protein
MLGALNHNKMDAIPCDPIEMIRGFYFPNRRTCADLYAKVDEGGFQPPLSLISLVQAVR